MLAEIPVVSEWNILIIEHVESLNDQYTDPCVLVISVSSADLIL